MKGKKKQQQQKDSGCSSKITPLYKCIVFVDKLKNYLALYVGFLYRGKWNALARVEIFRSKWSTSRGGPL